MNNKIPGRLYLRALEYSDLTILNKVRNDDKIFEYTCGNKYYISSEYDRKWIEDKIFNNKTQIYLMICLTDTKLPIGYLSINNIDFITRKALLGGIVIDSEYSSKGYATEALGMLVIFAFEELGMNKLYSEIIESNKASIRMVEKLGFTKEGFMREHVFKKNQYQDALLIGLLKKDYEECGLNKAGEPFHDKAF